MTSITSNRRPSPTPHPPKRSARQPVTELIRSIKSGRKIADSSSVPDIGDSEFHPTPAHPKRWPADLD